MFNEGDYVKVKRNTKLDSGEITNNWAGKIIKIHKEDNCCTVHLDAITLDLLTDEYLMESIFEELDPSEYVFNFEDLTLSKRRGNEIDMISALHGLTIRMSEMVDDDDLFDEFDDDEFDENDAKELEELIEKLINGYDKSIFYKSLTEFQKEEAEFTIRTFIDLMFKFETDEPTEWTPESVSAICLELVPHKITAIIENFENYGDILISFFKFLKTKNHINNADELIHTLQEIKHQIPIEASNPHNWSMAKTFMMAAMESGVDMEDHAAINKFISDQVKLVYQEDGFDSMPNAKVVQLNPFKDIGRNQKITVKYIDGKIVEDVKFKKVETDLKEGICELIKK